MKNIVRLLKINFLSILAIPLLILAVIAKLLSKMIEKLHIILAALGIMIMIALTHAVWKSPGTTLEIIGMILIVLFFFGVVIVLIMYCLSLILAVYSAILGLFSGIMVIVYEVCYEVYIRIYDMCKKDYELLQKEDGNRLYQLACVGWWLLKSMTWVITRVTSLALMIMGIVSTGGVLYILFAMNRGVHAALGISIFQYWGLFDKADIVINTILFVVMVGSIITILLTLGSEWSTWGKETYLAIQDYEGYLELIAEKSQAVVDQEITAHESVVVGRADQQREIQVKLDTYLDMLKEQLEELDTLDERMRSILALKVNRLLSEEYMKYINDINELVEEINTNTGFSIPKAQEWCNRVKKVIKVKNNIEQMLYKESSNKGASKNFFEGCKTQEERDKRYKALCKVYHPDVSTGNEEIFKTLQNEYEEKG